MRSFKSLLKRTPIYSFFNNNFNTMQKKITELENSICSLENNLSSYNQKINNIETLLTEYNKKTNKIENFLDMSNQKTSIDTLHQKVNIIANRTLQLDCINLELLLLDSNQKKQKILIVGFYGAPNTGDELMLQSILNKIDSNNYSITVLLADNANYKLENYKNINFIHYPKTNMDINILASYFDKIIFGGGALIEDDYYIDETSYKFCTSTILIDLSLACILNGKKTYHLGLSSSKELTNPSYISKLEFIINNSNYFSLRDTNSFKILENCGIKNTDKINIIHDLVYSLPPICYDFANINNSNKFIIGLILITSNDTKILENILIWIDEYAKKIKKEIKIKLIPFYDYLHSDIVNYTNLLNSLTLYHHVEILPYYQKYEDVINAFTECNLIVNMRYHSSLLSLKTGIPSIHIIYDIHPHYENKMDYLKETFVLSNLFLSYKNLTKDNFDNCLNYTLNNMEQISLLEKNISEKLEHEAQEQHINIINNILKD